MPSKLLILEDDADRLRRMRTAAATVMPVCELVTWCSAVDMLREMEEHMPEARLISLDHDLFSPPGINDDPGDGLQITVRLAELKPCCPVIIHSSNVDRAWQMRGVLSLGGWMCHRVHPVGDDWIEADWLQVIAKLLTERPSE